MTMRAIIDSITEAARMGNAVQLQEIPPKYKGLKMLGRGTTTVTLELNDREVLLFTRDDIKAEYLRDVRLAEIIDRYDSRRNRTIAMNDLPIIVLRMPKLVKLSGPNIRLVKHAVQEFLDAWYKTFRGTSVKVRHREDAIRQMLGHFSEEEDHLLAPLCRFLLNYDVEQYGFDIRPGNFMQTVDGQIVVLDPIASQQVLDIINDAKKARYED